ncbi:hypothetical protein [Sediminitomix flava]|uniref:Uncharacterized protein n=1 Tax=Sediminitomix flava TaxID=379075 RepID=A0A315Z0Q4_SEDFL|nr:hypothetical protein [Sediminitomix flava]PWJ36091.1 hypothetical protein BC781_109107 [Sediminitomix flava]
MINRQTNSLFGIVGFLALSLSMLSCNNNDETSIANGVIDERGLVISVNWINEENELEQGADLDLFLELDSSIILSAESSNPESETIELPFNFPDGTYELFIKGFNNLTLVEYDFTAKGSSSSLEFTPWPSGVIADSTLQAIEVRNNWFIEKRGARFEFLQ